jgi:1-acyl-sn-glycerol-3-phosphate acyltransferase
MTEVKKHSTWRYRSTTQGVFRTVAQLLLLKPAVWGVLTIRVLGRKNLKKIKSNRAFIVAPNHSSLFDAPLVVGALPRRLANRLAIGAAADYFFRAWYKALPTRAFFNTFPIDRDKSGRYKGLTSQLLGENVPILMMPEGTRSRNGVIGKFKPGVAAMSIKCQVPIVPVALVGANAAWPPGNKIWRSGRPLICVNFGEPLLPKSDETVEQFNNRLHQTIIKLHDDTAQVYNMPTQAEIRSKSKQAWTSH